MLMHIGMGELEVSRTGYGLYSVFRVAAFLFLAFGISARCCIFDGGGPKSDTGTVDIHRSTVRSLPFSNVVCACFLSGK